MNGSGPLGAFVGGARGVGVGSPLGARRDRRNEAAGVRGRHVPGSAEYRHLAHPLKVAPAGDTVAVRTDGRAWYRRLFSVGLVLIIRTPNGHTMNVLISEDPQLPSKLNGRYDERQVFIVPSVLGCALDHSIATPDLIVHQTGFAVVRELPAMAAQQHDPCLLPPCCSQVRTSSKVALGANRISNLQ